MENLSKLEDTGYWTNGYRQLEIQARRGAMNIVDLSPISVPLQE